VTKVTNVLVHSFIQPNWPAPLNVHALQTTWIGGASARPCNSLNLGDHVNDREQHVAQNRQLLAPFVPTDPVWMKQVHGTRVLDAAKSSCIESADAEFTNKMNVLCVTMTADCLPVLLYDQQGSVVAAAHEGWRSLCDGVTEATVNAMPVENNQLMAWLGPLFGPDAFEVGEEVRTQFIDKDSKQRRLSSHMETVS
jgi:YfiH family protein